MNVHVSWVANVWKQHKGLLALMFGLTLVSSAVAVALPYLAKLLLDLVGRIVADPSHHPAAMAEVDRLLLVFLVVGLVSLVSGTFPGVRGAINAVFEYVLRKAYFAFTVRKGQHFFHSFRSGDLVTRLTDDLSDYPKLSWFLCSGIFRAVESVSKILFCIGAMIILNPALTLFSLLPLPVMIIIYYIVQDRIYDTFRKNQEAISDVNNQLEMSFSGVRIIKSYVCEDKYRRFFSGALERRFRTEMAVAKLDTVLNLIYQYIEYFGQIGIIFVGGYLAVKGRITIGTFYAFYNYLAMMIIPILDIPQLFVSGKRAFVNIDRLEEIRNFPERRPGERSGKAGAGKDPGIIRSIEFRGVSYSYEGRDTPSLSDINFSVAAGERVCIIGPVGAGKTTLVRLIAGVLEPDKGAILVNGIPLTEIDLDAYRARIGYVPQEPLLFSGTLRENVAFGKAGMSEDDLSRAIATAQLSGEIDSFASGVETRIGQRGTSVSGGQKQRIAIARAVVREPDLLLLDDITASLDAANEERLWKDLDTLAIRPVCFIVSHRLSSIQYVDTVIFLDNGRIEARGRHEDLLGLESYRSFIAGTPCQR